MVRKKRAVKKHKKKSEAFSKENFTILVSLIIVLVIILALHYILDISTITKDNKGAPLYLTDKKSWKKWIPADLISESFPDRVR